MNQPFWRAQRNTWAVLFQGRQVNLGKDKVEAFRKYHALMAGVTSAAPGPVGPTAGEVIDQFLTWCESHQAAGTHRIYRWHLTRFRKAVGTMRLSELKPFHVTRWLDGYSCAANTANLAVRCAVRPFSWAKKQGLIEKNPLAGVERPSATPRECYLTEDQFDKITAAVPDREFQDFLTFARETGARPQEIRAIEKRHFDPVMNAIVFPRNESKGKKRQRVIVLNSKALAIVQRLIVKQPAGPVFRNVDGQPWKRDAVGNRAQRLKRKLGFPFCVYAIRHTWITDALLNGVEPLTVATLAGHSSIDQVWSTYQKLQLQRDHMRNAAEQAVRRKQA